MQNDIGKNDMNERSLVPDVTRGSPPTVEDLDGYVCWSRMQAEAGQGLEAIVARKELERRAGGGLFTWGVGNPPSTAIASLARLGSRIPVVFSVMKGRPKAVDVAPARIFAWRRYFDASGNERPLPPSAVVTSRADSARGEKNAHYALMCFSPEPLNLQRGAAFEVSAYRNVGGTGAPVGASQVTALLRRTGENAVPSGYEVNLAAWLTGSYWVRLSDPVLVSASAVARLDRVGPSDAADWLAMSSELRDAGPSIRRGMDGGLLL